MRFRPALLISTLALMGGCALADSTQPTNPTTVTFAPSLGIDLSTYTKLYEDLYYKDEVIGTGVTAQQGKKVIVTYTGWLSDGTQFDSRTLKESPLDDSSFIPGWVLGIPGMKVGGKRRLLIGSSFAYGAAGNGPIPPHATIVFDVELNSVR